MPKATLLRAALLTAIAVSAHAAAPSVEAFRQALTKKLIGLKLASYSERNVLFQQVTPGDAIGSSGTFRATVLIRDYNSGYPPNRYYGTTCVGLLEQTLFTMTPDGAGGWDVQGAMTPPLEKKQCKDNPSAGISSIPLASLQGTPATAGNAPPPAATPGGGQGLAQGFYECWANGQARMLMNFSISAGGRYTDSESKAGTYSFDGANNRVTFKDGMLDGVLPTGFYAVYYAPQGRPTVSFRNSGGSEITYCQKVR